MARAKLPELSAAEHIYYSVAVCFAALASNIASVLLFGTDLHGTIAWGVTVPIILLTSQAVVVRWALRRGRPLVTRKQWDDARTVVHRSWAVSVAFGFMFGFAALGTSSKLPVSGDPDWADRMMKGAVFAALTVLIAMPWRKPEDRRD